MSLLSFAPTSYLAFTTGRGHLLCTAAGLPPLQWKLGLKPIPAFSVGLFHQYPLHLGLALKRPRFVAQGLSAGAEDLLHDAVATAAALGGLLESVTREGNPQELLRGPLYYVVILMLCALLFWRDSPVGVVSLAIMCGGDGMADIIGRRFGFAKIPYNQRKSWAGSISMLVFGFLISIGMLYYYSVLGYMQMDWVSTVQRVALISLIATMVESLPISDLVDDNISVPLATMAMTFLSFRC